MEFHKESKEKTKKSKKENNHSTHLFFIASFNFSQSPKVSYKTALVQEGVSTSKHKVKLSNVQKKVTGFVKRKEREIEVKVKNKL